MPALAPIAWARERPLSGLRGLVAETVAVDKQRFRGAVPAAGEQLQRSASLGA